MYPDSLDLSDTNGARKAADFYESYANTVMAELEEQNSASRTDTSGIDETRWTLLVDAASSFREAGQWALLFDLERSRDLLQQAGNIFKLLDHPFGLFLLASIGHLEFEDLSLDTNLRILASLNHPNLSTREDILTIPHPMHHPQQQAYLLLTLSSIISSMDSHHQDSHHQNYSRHRSQLMEICKTSPHSLGGTPVGAASLPIRFYWQIAASFLNGKSNQIINDYIVPFLNIYIENIKSASANTYLWSNAATPVDVADIDIIGVTALAVRRFGSVRISADVDKRKDSISPIGLQLIEIGMRLV